MDDKKLMRKSYQQKFDNLKQNFVEIPTQGWIRTIRDFFGMTTTQLACKLGVNQSRVVRIEKNEKNTKISTMERIADALNCDFVYAFVPRENIDKVIYNQARNKALKILNKINKNMGLENQLSKSEDTLEDLIKEILDNNIARIWDED